MASFQSPRKTSVSVTSASDSQKTRSKIVSKQNAKSTEVEKVDKKVDIVCENHQCKRKSIKNRSEVEEIEKILKHDKDYENLLKILKQHFQKRWLDIKPSPFGSLNDFSLIAVIGVGSYGTVRLVSEKNSGKCYATKVLLKSKVIQNKQLPNVLSEKKVLQSVRFPFLVNLEFSLKDNDCIYFGLPYIGGGELFAYHRKCKKFNEPVARFYAAQVFLALDYLHKMDLVYRDLKPENILIDERGYLKLTDFGFCKKIEGRTATLCGTPEYLSPEIIQAKPYGLSVDWWAFGIFVYELVAGLSPFFTPHEDVMSMYSKIVKNDFRIPSSFSSDLRNLVTSLIQVDITKRFGNLRNGSNDIKNHSWFKDTNWNKLLLREVDVPFVPCIKSASDWSNFDKYPDLVYRKSKHNKYVKEFKDF